MAKKCKLSELCDVRDGTHDSPEYVQEGYPLVTSKNIVDGYLDLSVVNYISESDYNHINGRSKVDLGDIIMPMIGTIGNPHLIKEEPNFAIKNVALIKFPKSDVSNKFIYYFLQSDAFKTYVAENNRGGTQKFLSLKDIRNMEIPALSYEKQLEICVVLDKVCELTALRKEQLAKLDELVKSRFVELFGDCKTYAGFEECIEIKDNLRKPISSEERAKMQDGTLYPYYGATGQVGWINAYLSDFEGICIAEDCGNYAAGEASSYIVRGRIWVNNHAHLLKCRENINIYFLNEYFRQADLMDYVNGATRLKLTQSAMKTIPILFPPLELQNQFAAFVEQTDKSKLAIQESFAELETLKRALMQKYFG